MQYDPEIPNHGIWPLARAIDAGAEIPPTFGDRLGKWGVSLSPRKKNPAETKRSQNKYYMNRVLQRESHNEAGRLICHKSTSAQQGVPSKVALSLAVQKKMQDMQDRINKLEADRERHAVERSRMSGLERVLVHHLVAMRALARERRAVVSGDRPRAAARAAAGRAAACAVAADLAQGLGVDLAEPASAAEDDDGDSNSGGETDGGGGGGDALPALLRRLPGPLFGHPAGATAAARLAEDIAGELGRELFDLRERDIEASRAALRAERRLLDARTEALVGREARLGEESRAFHDRQYHRLQERDALAAAAGKEEVGRLRAERDAARERLHRMELRMGATSGQLRLYQEEMMEALGRVGAAVARKVGFVPAAAQRALGHALDVCGRDPLLGEGEPLGAALPADNYRPDEWPGVAPQAEADHGDDEEGGGGEGGWASPPRSPPRRAPARRRRRGGGGGGGGGPALSGGRAGFEGRGRRPGERPARPARRRSGGGSGGGGGGGGGALGSARSSGSASGGGGGGGGGDRLFFERGGLAGADAAGEGGAPGGSSESAREEDNLISHLMLTRQRSGKGGIPDAGNLFADGEDAASCLQEQGWELPMQSQGTENPESLEGGRAASWGEWGSDGREEGEEGWVEVGPEEDPSAGWSGAGSGWEEGVNGVEEVGRDVEEEKEGGWGLPYNNDTSDGEEEGFPGGYHGGKSRVSV